MRIGLDEVRRVAELAHIRLTDEELPRMARELSVILDYIDQLSIVELPRELDMTSDATPMRDDVVGASLDPQDVSANAPAFLHDYFVVPRVLGGE